MVVGAKQDSRSVGMGVAYVPFCRVVREGLAEPRV